MFSMTDNARKKVIAFLEEDDSLQGKFLRIFAEAGGCSGFQYGLTFDEKKDGDELVEFEGFEVVVDTASAMYVKGVEVDYHEGVKESGFNIKNPLADSVCGCGESYGF